MPRLTALDLSLTATGLFHGDPEDPVAPHLRLEIPTPSRRDGESDLDWNARRLDRFSAALLEHLRACRPALLVLEVTSHAHKSFTRGGARVETTRGQEFRAGLGLGRALGWVDGLKVRADAEGCAPARIETIEARDAKLRITGTQTASKTAVRNRLAETFGWWTEGWKESEVDALAAGLAYLRQADMIRREAALLEQAGILDARPSRPRKPRIS